MCECAVFLFLFIFEGGGVGFWMFFTIQCCWSNKACSSLKPIITMFDLKLYLLEKNISANMHFIFDQVRFETFVMSTFQNT